MWQETNASSEMLKIAVSLDARIAYLAAKDISSENTQILSVFGMLLKTKDI